MTEIRQAATSSAEATAIELVDRRFSVGEQQFLRYLEEAIVAVQNKRSEGTASVSALQEHVSSISSLMAEF